MKFCLIPILIALKYQSLFFRFFTVYGPWGRPDMALFKFTESILNNKEIEIFNNGNMERDFTYIDDLISGISSLISKIPKLRPNLDFKNDTLSKDAPYRIVNIETLPRQIC